MLNLEKHINTLLFQYDCVIVPGLGGFVANVTNANLNEKTGIFTPPSRIISFNKNLSHNDGLLISHIAKAEGLSFEECNSKLGKHVNVLKFQLSRGETITIGETGDLKTERSGNIVFTPNKNTSYSTESFGLPTFHFNSLEQIKAENEPTRHLVQRTIGAKRTRQIAASIALIMGLMFVAPEFENKTHQSNYSDLFPNFEQVNITTKEVSSPEVIVKTKTEELVDVNSIEDQKATPIVEIENSYFIIAGSFADEKPAKAFLNKLNSKGINTAEILAMNSNRYRVSLEGFNDKTKAIEALDTYRKRNGYSSAWLLTKKQ